MAVTASSAKATVSSMPETATPTLAVKQMMENDGLRNGYQLAGLKRVQDFSILNALMHFDKLIEE